MPSSSPRGRRGRRRPSPSSSPARRLGDLHPMAGTLTFPRDTDLMHNFSLYDAKGKLVRNTNHEAHEQFVVHHFLRPDDSVLEFGGGIGAQSIQINKTLRGAAKARHYVFEPQEELAKLIWRNRRIHDAKFKVVHGALTKERTMRVPRFSPEGAKWLFAKTSPTAAGPSVPTVSRLPLVPTAIVADCEGCLLKILQDFPRILSKIRMVYFENDGGADMYRAIKALLLARGMRQAVDTSHHKLFLLP